MRMMNAEIDKGYGTGENKKKEDKVINEALRFDNKMG